MLKRMSIKKIIVSTLTLITITLLYVIPSEKLEVKQELEYTMSTMPMQPIFLLDGNNYIARTNIGVKSETREDLVYELLEVMIINGKGESSVPSGFKSFIPSDTIINSVSFNEDTVSVDFNKDFLDVNEKLEETLIEGVVYSLTGIDGVKKVHITIDNKDLTFLPKSKINIPSVLDRTFGINKDYEVSTKDNITSLNLYYVGKHNDEFYYVPVTKYMNNNHEKIEIIIDELKNPMFNSNLMSFMNENVKLESYEFNDKNLKLVFNDGILSNFEEQDILEEVVYTIALSVGDSYDICSVSFNVGDEEIIKKGLDCE